MLSRPLLPFGPDEEGAVARVLASGWLWRGNGPHWGGGSATPGGTHADLLEDAFAAHIGIPFVHALNSGTSANEAAIAGLGLLPGDEVICPAASPVFVPFSVLAAGCIPVFADVSPETMLIEPRAVEKLVGERTRALVAVHLWGTPAPMTELLAIASGAGLRVVEDCAQAFGTTVDGRDVGTFGDVAVWSLQQSKQLSSGEGGLLATADPAVYARAVLYSNSGIPSFRYGIAPDTVDAEYGRGHLRFGHNHRMSELQAAVASVQVARAEDLVRRRRHLAGMFKDTLHERGLGQLSPTPVNGCDISYWKYPLRVPAGRGTYVGIPPTEPTFQRMQRERVTPFGLALPDTVTYAVDSCPGAKAGALQYRTVSVHHGLTDTEALAELEAGLAGLAGPT
jgi:perosamine synthetase